MTLYIHLRRWDLRTRSTHRKVIKNIQFGVYLIQFCFKKNKIIIFLYNIHNNIIIHIHNNIMHKLYTLMTLVMSCGLSDQLS